MLIKLDHAAKRYGDFALDCTLEVREGYVTGLVGANGSGKTTTFKTLLGLIDRDGGTAEVPPAEPEAEAEAPAEEVVQE